MKYKLIVLDLDGTLTNSKKVITPRNREILIRVQEQGVRLVLASGRPTYGIVPLANELRMNEFGGFILSYNGGEIINWETQEMLYENVLPNDVVPVLYECARSHQSKHSHLYQQQCNDLSDFGSSSTASRSNRTDSRRWN